MKRKSLLVALTLFMGLFLFACKPSDSKIQQSVNEKLSAIPGITADVKNGVVTLNGEVADETARTSAEDALKDIKGIKSVDNKIMVKAPEPEAAPAPVVINPDDVLRKSLDSTYAAAGFTNVTVSVDSGVVTLSGEATKADLKKIVQKAQESKPKKVVNNIKVK
ncbi:BON domain-containing protein [Chitinophaga sp. Cy-1792]|uniref:BON domain-containing protein n=1 Tax=Chitinophaga sp. Cy-1792 TaxID=2608339 RepID=UPI00141F8227|nr:BON domain-containing protein [Chitinophaga sp. Cy-1792]NIG52206.1 BON domain-containing protein [Chitinophaga sp. Cy-1792]